MIEYIGTLGLILLMIAWIPETIEMIQSKKARLNRKFIVIYFSGSFLLASYSFLINDLIFLILNSFIAIIALINAYYEFQK